MREIIYHCATSIDGFVAREDGTFDCFAMEGPHVDDFVAGFANYDTAIMGRKTYEVGLSAGVTNPYPMMKTFVFSKTMEKSPDEAVTLVSEDAARVVRALKEGEGKSIWMVGAGEFASFLFAHDLIDTICIKLNPILLGRGKPMVSALKDARHFELEETKSYDNGVVLLTYRGKKATS